MAYVIGIDTSTTATKAVLIDEAGRAVGIGVAEYDVRRPHEGDLLVLADRALYHAKANGRNAVA